MKPHPTSGIIGFSAPVVQQYLSRLLQSPTTGISAPIIPDIGLGVNHQLYNVILTVQVPLIITTKSQDFQESDIVFNTKCMKNLTFIFA